MIALSNNEVFVKLEEIIGHIINENPDYISPEYVLGPPQWTNAGLSSLAGIIGSEFNITATVTDISGKAVQDVADWICSL